MTHGVSISSVEYNSETTNLIYNSQIHGGNNHEQTNIKNRAADCSSFKL